MLPRGGRAVLNEGDVARQPPERAEPAGLPQHRADDHQHDAGGDEHFAEVVHAEIQFVERLHVLGFTDSQKAVRSSVR